MTEFLKDKNLSGEITDDEAFRNELLEIIGALKKDKKPWKKMSWQEALEFLMDHFEKDEAVRGKNKNILYEIMERSNDVEKRKYAIEKLARSEMKKTPEKRDNGRIKTWAEELETLGGEADLFFGVAAYRSGARVEEGKEERRQGYSRLEAIRRIKKHLDKKKDDEDALLFLADIYEKMHWEIYPGGLGYDTSLAGFFEKLSDYFREKSKKEKDEEKRQAALNSGLYYIELALMNDSRNAGFINKKVALLRELGRKDEASDLAGWLIWAGRKKPDDNLFGVIVTALDLETALKAEAEALIFSGENKKAIRMLTEGIRKRYRVWRGKEDSETYTLLSAANWGAGDREKAGKYRSIALSTVKEGEARVSRELLGRLADEAKDEGTYESLRDSVRFHELMKGMPGVDEKAEKKEVSLLEFELAEKVGEQKRPFRERISFWNMGERGKTDISTKIIHLKKAREYDPENNDIVMALRAVLSGSLRMHERFTRYNERSRGRIKSFLNKWFGRVPIDYSEGIIGLYESISGIYSELAEKDEENYYQLEHFLEGMKKFLDENGKELTPKYKELTAKLLVRKGDTSKAVGPAHYNDAMKFYDDAVTSDGKSVRAHLGKALILEEQGDLLGAARALEKAFGIDPPLDGFAAEYSKKIVELYMREGNIEKAKTVIKNMKEKYLQKEKEALEKKTGELEKKVAEAEDVILQAVEIRALREEIVKKKEAVGAVSEKYAGEKFDNFRKNDVNLDERLLESKMVDLTQAKNKDAFVASMRDESVFNAVIGNVRGRPLGEAVRRLEEFLFLAEEKAIGGQEIIKQALAELYIKQNEHEKAQRLLEGLDNYCRELIGPKDGFNSKLNLRQQRALLSVKVSLSWVYLAGVSDRTKNEQLRKAFESLYWASSFAARYFEQYGDAAYAIEAAKGLKGLVENAQRSGINISGDKGIKGHLMSALRYLLPIASGEAGILDAIKSVVTDDNEGMGFIQYVLALENVAGEIKVSLSNMLINKILRDRTILQVTGDISGTIQKLKVSSDDRIKARAYILDGLTEPNDMYARGAFKKALEYDKELNNIALRAIADTYKLNLIQKLRFLRKARKEAEPTALESLKSADREFDKGKYREAALNYEKAVNKDTGLNKDNRVMERLAISHLNAKEGMRARIGDYFAKIRDKEKYLEKRISALIKALDAAPDGTATKRTVIEELLRLNDELKKVIRSGHDRAGLKERSENVYKLGKKTASVQNDIGTLYLKLNEHEKAREAFKEALKYDPGNNQAISGLNEIVEKEKEPEEKDGKAVLKDAERSYKNGDYHGTRRRTEEETVRKDKELAEGVRSLEEKMKEIDSGIDRFLNNLTKLGSIAAIERLAREADPKGEKKKGVIKSYTDRLLDRDKETLTATTLAFKEWYRYRDGEKSDEEREKILGEIAETIVRSAGVESPEELGRFKDVFAKRVLVRAEEMIQRGKYAGVPELLDLIAGRDDINPGIRRKARYLKALAIIGKGDFITVAGNVSLYAAGVFAQVRDKKYRQELEAKLAGFFSSYADSLYGEKRKSERDRARAKAMGYFMEALKNGEKGDAVLHNKVLSEFIWFARRTDDKYFFGKDNENIDIIVRAIELAFEKGRLEKRPIEDSAVEYIIRVALKGALDKGKIKILKALFSAINSLLAAKYANNNALMRIPAEIFNNIRNTELPVEDTLKPELKDVAELLGVMREHIMDDEAYRLDIDAITNSGLSAAIFYALAGDKKNADDMLKDIYPARGSDEAKKQLVSFLIALEIDDDIDGAEFILKEIVKLDKPLTPYARMLLAKKYLGRALKMGFSAGTKDIYEELLNKAISHWPKFADALSARADLYREVGRAADENNDKQYAKDIKKYNDEHNTVEMPPESSEDKWEGYKEHVVKAPLVEQGKYFWPVIVAVPVVLLTDVLLGFTQIGSVLPNVLVRAGFVLGQIFLTKRFIDSHTGKLGTARFVGGANIAMNIFMSLLDISPIEHIALYYLMATIVHSLTNNVVFGLKKFFPKKEPLGYATVGQDRTAKHIPKPAEMMPARKIAGIGVVGGLPEDVEQWATEKYHYIEFVAISRGGEPGMEELSSKMGLPQVRQLLDVGIPTRGDIDRAVGEVSRQSFVIMRPYLAGLDAASIARLDGQALKRAMTVLGSVIIDESPSDDILGGLFASYTAEMEKGDFVSIAASPADVESWVKENVTALKAYQSAVADGLPVEAAVRTIVALRSRLNDFLAGKSQDEAAEILTRHERIAAAQAQEDEVSAFIDKLVGKELMPSMRAIAIDARSEAGFDMKAMMPALLHLAKKDKTLHIAIIDPENNMPGLDLPPNISRMTEISTKPLVEQIRDNIVESGRREIKDIPMEAISIATGEFMVEAIINNVNSSEGANRANFVISVKPEDDLSNRLIPIVTFMNLINRYSQNRDLPSVTVIGLDLESVFSKVKILLRKIDSLKIGESIREYINSITQAAISA